MTDRIVKVILRGDVAGLTGPLKVAARSMADTADQMTQASKESAKFRQGLTAVGDTAGKIGLAATAGLGMVVKAAMDWETAWAGVTKTVDGTDAQMAVLETGLRDLAKTLPATHSEIAAVAEAAGQLGVAREGILDFTKTMIDLSETTNLTADEAATSIAQMANVMGTAPDEIDNLGASLVAVGNAGASTEAQIIQMAQGISGAASVVGLAEADVLGIANAVASIGIEVEAGGSSISRVLTDMGKSVAEGGAKLNEFATTAGVSADEFATAFEQRPAEAFTMFIEGLGRIQTAGGNVFGVLDRLGMEDVRVSRALLGMAADSDKFAGSLQLANEAWEENTALAIEAAKRYDTTASKSQVAWNNIKDAAIEFGDAALPVVATVADGVAGLASAVGGLPGPVKAAGTGLMGITAVLGGGLWFASKAVNGVSDMRDALENLGVSASGAKGAMKGLGIAAAVLGGLAIGDALQRQVDETLPGLEALTKQLIELASAGAAAQLSAEFDSLDASITRLTDKNWAQTLQDQLYDWGAPGSDSAVDEAKAEIEALDQALANLVATGNAETAAKALENLGLPEEQLKALLEVLPQYEEALIGVENDAALAAGATDEFAGAMDGAADSTEDSTAAIQENIDAMRDQVSAAIDAANAEIGYQSALDDARASAKENGKTLDITTEKGRANKRALLELASAWNAQDDTVKNGKGARKAAIDQFVALAGSMGMNADKARDLAQGIYEIPSKKVVEFSTPGLDAFKDGVWDLTSAINALPSTKTITFSYITRGTIPNTSPSRVVRASGGPVYGPGTATSDSIPAWLSNGEFVMKAAAVQKYGLGLMHDMNSMRLAGGGPVGMAKGGSVDDRLEVLRLQQQINDLRRDLADDGKDSLKGIARAIAEAELEAAKRDLRQARRSPFVEKMDALRSIELDVEGGATVAETREALREFRKDVRDAGGEWTKQMAKTAHGLIDLAKAQGATRRSLEQETVQRDRLAEKLDEQIRVLEDVKQAMESYSASVSGNFLTDPFGGRTLTATGGSAAPGPNPALAGTMASLADAQSRLAGIRASGGDPLDRSYRASKVVAEIAELERQADDLGRRADGATDAVEQTVDVLEVLRETLLRDVEAARAMNDALATLSTNGLNPGLYQQLAASGDVDMASALASLGASDLAEINALWAERQEAAAQVATLATQQVFGAQLDAATKAVQLTEKTLARQDKTIERLNQRLENLGDRVEKGAERGVAALGKQIQALQAEVRSIPRELETNRRKR